jgi:hypothetical protein
MDHANDDSHPPEEGWTQVPDWAKLSAYQKELAEFVMEHWLSNLRLKAEQGKLKHQLDRIVEDLSFALAYLRRAQDADCPRDRQIQHVQSAGTSLQYVVERYLGEPEMHTDSLTDKLVKTWLETESLGLVLNHPLPFEPGALMYATRLCVPEMPLLCFSVMLLWAAVYCFSRGLVPLGGLAAVLLIRSMIFLVKTRSPDSMMESVRRYRVVLQFSLRQIGMDSYDPHLLRRRLLSLEHCEVYPPDLVFRLLRIRCSQGN